ncbi:hypothetical protein VCHENC02_1614A, partial [Vibrio harveyi]
MITSCSVGSFFLYSKNW